MALETPELAAGAPEAGLHLVSEEEAAPRPDRGGGGGEETGGVGKDAIGGEDGVDDQQGGPDALRGHPVAGLGHGLGEALGDALRVVRGGGGGDREDGGAGGDGGADRHRHLGSGKGDAVIGVVGDDDPAAAGRGAGDAEREVVRLRPGAGEHDVAEVGGEMREETLGIGQDRLVQVAGVGGERRGLLCHRLNHAGVAMADGGDVVVAVEVGGPVGGVEVDALPTGEVDRGFVEEPVGGAERLGAAAGEGFVCRRELACAGGIGVQHRGLAGHVGWLSRMARSVSVSAAGSVRASRPAREVGALRRM